MKFELWHAFVIGAVLSWGVYVPVLHEGQSLLGGRPSQGALRAFLCVGLAYLITAVVIPLILFALNMTAGEPLDFTREGAFNSAGFLYALPGTRISVLVEDPLARPTLASFLLDGTTAYVESAQAAGLHLLDPEDRDPAVTTTYGVGQLVVAAVGAGATTVVVGLGGSATNDVGAGFLAAMGVARLGTKDDAKNVLALYQDASAEMKKMGQAGKCWDEAEKEFKLPKYESMPGYANGLPFVARRYCGLWGRGT